MAFTKYTWVGNRISEKNMASLYKLKTTTRKPITEMVSEAVELYLSKPDLISRRNKHHDKFREIERAL